MASLLSDLRVASRKLTLNKGFTAVVVSTLALGIGATTAIFSVMYAVVLRPLPFDDPDALVAIEGVSHERDVAHGPASMGDFVDWREQAQSFSSMDAMGHAVLVMTEGGEPEEIPTAAVSHSFFRTLAVTPMMGRDFRPEEETPGLDQVVLLSHSLWQRRFSGDEDVVGRQIRLSGYEYVIIGVLPPDFDFPGRKIDFWSPIALDLEDLLRERRGLTVFARLKEGVSIEQAREEMAIVAQRLEEAHPDSNSGWGATVVSLHDKVVGGARSNLRVLLAATAVVLLIACGNVATLLLVRASSRHREVALRTALGAGRATLFRQFIVEGVLLSVTGGVLGVFLALWGVRILIALIPGNVPRLAEVSVDAPVLLFALAVSLATGIILGLVPALRALRTDLQSSLKEGESRGSRGPGRARTGEVFIVAEVAAALLLLISSSLLIRSFTRLTDVDPGFNPTHLLIVDLFLPGNKYSQPHEHSAFFQSLHERVGNLPGVDGVATSTSVPMNDNRFRFDLAFTVPGRADRGTGDEQRADIRLVSPEYFKTFGTTLRSGQSFTRRDLPESPRVAVINETMARRFWPDEDAVGQRFEMDYRGPQSVEVLGIVKDVQQDSLEDEPRPEIYLSSVQFPFFFSSLLVRTQAPPLSLLDAVKSEIWALDSEQTFTVNTMEGVLAKSVADRGFIMILTSLFAAVALILTMIGVYGLVSYEVGRRTTEIGIRMALGARPAEVLGSVLGRSLVLTVVGAVVGILGASFTTGLLEDLLFGVSRTDLLTFLVAPLLLTLLALLGTYRPARRAMRVDPKSALHYE